MNALFISLLPVILLCGVLTKSAAAQNKFAAQPSAGFIGWDASKLSSPDVAIAATIQEVIPNNASGIPSGLHLMLKTPQGVLNASIGPYLNKAIQQALVAGKQIQVIGQVKTFHDQKYLLVRQLVMDGKSIVVRNDHGSLVRTRPNERSVTQFSLSNQNGGTK